MPQYIYIKLTYRIFDGRCKFPILSRRHDVATHEQDTACCLVADQEDKWAVNKHVLKQANFRLKLICLDLHVVYEGSLKRAALKNAISEIEIWLASRK